jgi:hypothetical protein
MKVAGKRWETETIRKHGLLLVFLLISTLVQRVGQGGGGKREDRGS